MVRERESRTAPGARMGEVSSLLRCVGARESRELASYTNGASALGCVRLTLFVAARMRRWGFLPFCGSLLFSCDFVVAWCACVASCFVSWRASFRVVFLANVVRASVA